MRIDRFMNNLEMASDQLESLNGEIGEILAKVGTAYGHRGELPLPMELATHDLPDAMYVHRYAIIGMMRFLHFHREYGTIDKKILEGILEPEAVSVDTKKKLLSLGMSGREALDLIESSRERWHSFFGESRYLDVADWIGEMIRSRTSSL